MPTLAELTLTLSQDITRNERERAAALAALEAERLQALAAVPGAATPMRKHADALAAAAAERDETLVDIEADLREGARLIASRRRADDEQAEQRLRDADEAAERVRRGAEDKARAAFDAAALAIDRKDLAPGQKVLARAEARRVMDDTVAAAQDAFAAARLASQDRLLDDRRAALLREANDARDNRDKAAGRRTAAEHLFALAVRVGDGALQAALAAVPGAAALDVAYAERRGAIDRRFDANDAALRAAFRQARERLRERVSPSRPAR